MEPPSVWGIAQKIWRRKFWLLTPALLGLCVAQLAVRRVEPRYQARAVLYVEAQKIPESFVAEVVTTNLEQRLRQMEQQIRRDEILEPIVRQLRLFPTLLDQGRISDAVDRARRSMTVRLDVRGRTLKIAYSGTDRRLVADAANLIADKFVEQNSEIREQQTRQTTIFVQAQITDVLQQRQALAEEIAQRKREWDGKLPEQRQGHLRAIVELERTLNSTEADIDNAETRRVLLQRADGTLRESPALTSATGRSQLEELQTELRRLRSRYTDRHPDVIRLRLEIEAVEQARETTPDQDVPGPEQVALTDPVIGAEVQAINLELERLRADRIRLINGIGSHRRQLDVAPEIEQELASLERQYRTVDTLYTTLLRSRTEAELAEKLEAQKQSEQLSVLSRAGVPSKPYTPKVPMWLLVGLVLGGTLGLGLVFLREELDQTFNDPDSLSEAFPGAVLLTVIPTLEEHAETPDLDDGERRTA